MGEHTGSGGELSRRKFGACGALALGGAAAETAARGSPGVSPSAGTPAAGRARVGFVLSHEQFPTATLATLARGRTFLGVGTGEAVNELAGTGQFGKYPERHDRLVEAITLIRQLWSGQRVSFRGRYFRTEQLKLYDLPQQPPPIYVAAGGPKSARLAGQYGDGWITTGGAVNSRLRAAFQQGGRAAGKDPARMPIFVESFVVVGDESDVDYAAQRWRFLAAPPTARLVYQPNPVTIEQIAQRTPLRQVTSSWVRGTDPTAHIAAARALLDAGATPFIHAPQADPRRVIDFYGHHVLPQLHA